MASGVWAPAVGLGMVGSLPSEGWGLKFAAHGQELTQQVKVFTVQV